MTLTTLKHSTSYLLFLLNILTATVHTFVDFGKVKFLRESHNFFIISALPSLATDFSTTDIVYFLSPRWVEVHIFGVSSPVVILPNLSIILSSRVSTVLLTLISGYYYFSSEGGALLLFILIHFAYVIWLKIGVRFRAVH